MGIIANRKFKKATKLAQENYDNALARYQADKDLLAKMLEIFDNAKKGIDSVSNTTVNKSGEVILWTYGAVLHETRRGPSTFIGHSSGYSFPVAGIRFRVGAMQGQSIPGADSQTDLDEGYVTVTTERIIFAGSMYTKEWDFSKLLGATAVGSESDYIFNVSNREKSSGVRINDVKGPEFNRLLALAILCAESGVDDVLKELAQIGKDLPNDEPKLELPAAPQG